MANIERSEAEPTVPARLLDDVRVSMKELLAQNVNAWGEVDRLHEQLRGAVEAFEELRAVLSDVSAFETQHGRVYRARELVTAALDRFGGQ